MCTVKVYARSWHISCSFSITMKRQTRYCGAIRPIITLMVSILLLFLALAYQVAATDLPEKIAPGLQQRLVGSTEMIPVVAFFKVPAAATLQKAGNLILAPRKVENHAALISQLQERKASADFSQMLTELAGHGAVRDITSYWIADVISFEVSPAYVNQILSHPDLYYLVEDKPLQLIEPVTVKLSASGHTGAASAIDVTGVRELWNQGYTGHGRLVCSFDTGVEGDHPALVGNWLGTNGGTAEQSWLDPFGTAFPTDGDGHGTHTMGIMVGRDGADTIGVAFNANWISAAVVDRGQSLSKTLSDIIAAFQWAADPDGDPNTVADLPDVVSNSWGIPTGLLAPCDETFWQVIDNLEALGVVTIFACGNEGPDTRSIRNPADRGSGPLNSFSVGAVDQNQPDLPIANFSSRGPSNCDDNIIKPELVGPGTAIRSSYSGGGYRVISGTSMAAPFVAGAVALLREYNPDATVAEIKNALILSATDLGVVGEDNDYGWGFINVARALDYLPTPEKANLQIVNFQLAGTDNAILSPGNTTSLELVVSNTHVAVTDLWVRIRTDDLLTSILQDSVYFGSVGTDGQIDNSGDPFLIKLHHQASLGKAITCSVDFYSVQHGFINTAAFPLITGQPAVGQLFNLGNGRISYQVSNFGTSRCLSDSATQIDPLSLLTLILADESGTVYDGLPGNLDFLAVDTITLVNQGNIKEARSTYQTTDGNLLVAQATVLPAQAGEDDFVLLKYRIDPLYLMESLYLGLILDADFDGGETLIRDEKDFLFGNIADSRYFGLRFLVEGSFSGRSVAGADLKSGTLTESEKYDLLMPPASSPWDDCGDLGLMVSFNLPLLSLDTEAHFAVILAVGSSRQQVKSALVRGEWQYNQVTAIESNEDNILPALFTLSQNFPNPFNSGTVIEFSLPRSGDYRFAVYNMLGQLVDYRQVTGATAGRQVITWQGTDRNKQPVASGVYFYRITFGGNSQIRKMVLLK